MKPKILIIGIDGGSWDIFEPVMEQGHMPHLKALRDGGVSGILASTRPPTTAPAWATLMTGVQPGKHRVLGFESYDCGKETIHLSNSHSIACETMWSYLGRQDFKVASLNMPMTYPPFEVNGVMVSGFGCPGTQAAFTYPAALKDEVLREIPNYEILMGWKLKDTGHDESKLTYSVDKALQCYEAESKLYNYISEEHGWDVLLLQTHEIDRFLHFFLSQVQPETWRTGKEHPEVVRFFKRLDELIGNMCRRTDPGQDIVAVLSDHGHGAHCSTVKPNKLLYEWGYLRTRYALGRILYRLRKDIANLKKGDRSRRQSGMNLADMLKINWAGTRAYVAHVNHHGFLFVNLKNRQKNGIVEPGKEYDQLLGELQERFRGVTDPQTGEAIYEQVATPEEFFGVTVEDRGFFGDLILVPKENYWHKRTLRGNDFIERPAPNDGFHHPRGMLLLHGANIKPNMLLDADIADVVPTIYAALGVPLPANLDGRVLLEAFVNPPEIKNTGETISCKTLRQESHFDNEDEALIAERLSDMGYLQ